jgi:glycosyltransferase involved in cell wall biosynthesis
MIVTVLTPVYHDWQCFVTLVQTIDRIGWDPDVVVQILAVNDSAVPAPADVETRLENLERVVSVAIVNLIRNLGHQRAIAVGLVEIAASAETDVVIVMDSDGEDQPADIVRLLDAHRQNSQVPIVARRKKRSENLRFRLFYRLYKLVFKVLTGETIDFGNYSLLPRNVLDQLVYYSELWNHLAATLNRSGLSLLKLETERGKRYDGTSKMRLVRLIFHGLSAIAAYNDVVFVRLLIISSVLVVAAVACIGAVVFIRLFTDLAIPGWATFAAGLLLIFAFQAITFSGGLTFVVLNTRSQPFLVPRFETPKLVKSRTVIFNAVAAPTPLREESRVE